MDSSGRLKVSQPGFAAGRIGAGCMSRFEGMWIGLPVGRAGRGAGGNAPAAGKLGGRVANGTLFFPSVGLRPSCCEA